MNRLLVIRFSALGDVALLVPVVRATAEEFPELEITVLSQACMADLFGDMPANVRFVGVDLKKQSLRKIVSCLGHYDYVADAHGVWRSWYIDLRMWLRGAKVRMIHKGRWSKWLLTHGWLREPLKHTTERYADVIGNSFKPLQNHVKTTLKPRSDTVKNTIGIAPFAAHAGKTYPIAQMEQVVKQLSEQGEQVVLFGSQSEAEVLEQWAKKYPHVESVAGRKRLSEELELMRRLKVMISMDSANMHLASIVGTRVVSVWGATHPKAGFMGIGQSEKDCVQRDLKCRPCSVYGNKKCKFGDYRCLAIRPEEIVQRAIQGEL